MLSLYVNSLGRPVVVADTVVVEVVRNGEDDAEDVGEAVVTMFVMMWMLIMKMKSEEKRKDRDYSDKTSNSPKGWA